DADTVLAQRRDEADEFHASLLPATVARASAQAAVARQALAGLVWGQCFYHYNVQQWLAGDPTQPAPPAARRSGRNARWWHLDNREVISMPDPWEYPWYASWDLAFHTVALAHADPDLAKEQLLLLCREWYMAPSGQLPAYEWDFSDVNPPVHAWAALEVFRIDGGTDTGFLERIFHKLLINHTWWTNREDQEGNNVFEGGFLGLDNVGAFDRSHLPPGAGRLEQADATAWMASFTLDLLAIALELATRDDAYEDVATKFFEHFTYIAAALDQLWDDEDGFYYDRLETGDGQRTPVRVRSVAGLVSLCASRMLPAAALDALPSFRSHFRWFLEHREPGSPFVVPDGTGAFLLTAVPVDRLRRLVPALLDEAEFLSPYGLRSLSKAHAARPYSIEVGGTWTPPVDYEPGESTTALFGGNSNWRGPVWFPLNALVITALRRRGPFYGDRVTVQLPTGTGPSLRLDAAADVLAARLVSLFVPGGSGQPPAAGPRGDWPAGLLQFHEYFHGDTGAGLGASHQTGWTALVADLVLRS
ncbi:MAG: MGH1-like glycoside hydrolase domain-containing protein, partial [Mycobacteriales bacterium]